MLIVTLFAVTNETFYIGNAPLAPESLLGGQQSLAVWGDDSSTPEVDGALPGDIVELYLVQNDSLYHIEYSTISGDNSYVPNGMMIIATPPISVDVVTAGWYGCIGSGAATIDPSCAEVLPGCMDSNYIKYNDLATEDDGSCATAIVFGCIDASASNFNPNAIEDDGSCEFPGLDITFPIGDGWNMVGYTGDVTESVVSSINAALNNSTIGETFEVIKNVQGKFWSLFSKVSLILLLAKLI